MRNWRTLASLGLAAALCVGDGSPAPTPALPPALPPASYLRSVVEIRVDDGSLAPAIATGWIGPCGLVVTVAHALDGARGVLVDSAGGRIHQADIVALDNGPDLALLRVNGLRAPRLALAAGGIDSLGIVVRRFDQATLLAVQVRRHVGISIDERSGSHRRLGLEFTPALASGDSGAPIVDGQGRVVGVAFATNDSVAYASATSELRALMVRTARRCRSD